MLDELLEQRRVEKLHKKLYVLVKEEEYFYAESDKSGEVTGEVQKVKCYENASIISEGDVIAAVKKLYDITGVLYEYQTVYEASSLHELVNGLNSAAIEVIDGMNPDMEGGN